MLNLKLSPMSRRLLPLYVAAFLQAMPFWYAIEKLFMIEIGFNTASIGIMVAIMSIVMLVVETPSGILADRWSRKGVMIIGCGALVVSSVIGAISFNEPIYIVSTVFWGIYAALYSGTYDSVIYDITLEEYGDSNKFEYYLGRLRAVEGLAFVVGALAGGILASVFSMRETYILTLPFILAAFFFLWRFREPQLHKSEIAEPVLSHIHQTFAAVLKNSVLLPVIVAVVGFGVLQETIFELSQLWFIAVVAPLALYGLFSAVIFSSWSIGGILAAKIKLKSHVLVTLIIIVTSMVGLVFARHYWLILAAQFAAAVCLVALSVILARKMHDELPSRLRAGSASVVSTLVRGVLIPMSLVFTSVANSYNLFSATYILLAITIVSIVAFLFISPIKRQSQHQ